MKSFKTLTEETKKTLAMLFGRMNPPTKGHEENVEGLKAMAARHNADHLVVASHSQDAKKNPLSAAQKLKHLKRSFPNTNITTSSKEMPTILHQASEAHKNGYTHLIVAGGGDRVDEYKRLLNHYNGVEGRHGYYNFKKIDVKSTGERVGGVSGTDMRNHAQNNDYQSFKSGLSSHMQKNDKHAKELFNDVRKGMGLHEDVTRGLFKAIFITGGPGSGKDIIIREGIAEQRAVELSTIQAYGYLMDKKKLSESSKDFRREAIRNRGPLIINGSADNIDMIGTIKEELEELGYSTMMVYVDTINEISKQRNEGLKRMIAEAIREEKWQKSQVNKVHFHGLFEDFNLFKNNDDLDVIEESITDVYEHITDFLDRDMMNDISIDWLARNRKIGINEKVSLLFKGTNHAEKNSKSIQKASPGIKGQYIRDNNAPIMQLLRKSGKIDSVKDGDVASNSGYTFRTYEEKSPTLKINPPPKEPNFQQDKDKIVRKKKRWTDAPTVSQRLRNTTGIGPEFDTRQQGTVYPMSGLGDVTYREETSPDKYILEGAADGPRKSFKSIRTNEAIDDPGAHDMGVGGTLSGAMNKDPIQTYKDQSRNIGIIIKKKKVKK